MKIERDRISPSPSKATLLTYITSILASGYKSDSIGFKLKDDEHWQELHKHVKNLPLFELGDHVHFSVSGELEGIQASVRVKGHVVELKLQADNVGWYIIYGIAEDPGCAFHSPIAKWWRKGEEMEHAI